jgi:hypothetical protein
MAAPICLIPTTVSVPPPPAVAFPSIPLPEPTIPGLVASVSALKNAVELLSGQNNNVKKVSGVINGFSIKDNSKQQKKTPAQGRWVETNRVTATVRITNPQDSTQYVDVLRINQLTFTDSVTGETWVWNR